MTDLKNLKNDKLMGIARNGPVAITSTTPAHKVGDKVSIDYGDAGMLKGGTVVASVVMQDSDGAWVAYIVSTPVNRDLDLQFGWLDASYIRPA